jgi:copper chaperone NosL
MQPRERRHFALRRLGTLGGGIVAALLVTGCEPRPDPILYGEDVCAHCRMVIVDERYGAELVTTKGRVFKFDSIECLAAFVLDMEDSSEVHSLWVTAFHAPGELMQIADAVLLHSETLNSPMGGNLTAFRAAVVGPDSAVHAFGGQVLSWGGILELVAARPPSGSGHMPMHRPQP